MSEEVSGSLRQQLNIPPLNYDVKDSDRVLSILVNELDHLKKKVHKLETEKILDETQLSQEILEENNLVPPEPKKIKKGKGFRPLLKSEIEDAKKHTCNEAETARWLGVTYGTYKKYAKLYGIFDPKPNVKGKRGIFSPNRGKYPLNEILEGKHPNVSLWTVKDKLLRSGIKKLECEVCGFNQRRSFDNKLALLLNHMDDDTTNHRLENLKLMCLNCTFLAGRGYIRRSNFKLDPDWMQDALMAELKKPSRY